MDTEKLIKIARGEEKADLVIKNANLVNVFNDEIKIKDIAIYQGKIAGVGKGYQGIEELDLNGAYVTPAFIDGHVHIESSMCLPKEFALQEKHHGEVTRAIIDKYAPKEESVSAPEKVYICSVCGFEYEGELDNESDDYKCPLCGMPKTAFKIKP